MLMLSRKKGQDILIGDDIVVSVMGQDSYGRYRIGIQAPKNISIVRREIAHEFDDKGNRLGVK